MRLGMKLVVAALVLPQSARMIGGAVTADANAMTAPNHHR